MKKLSSLSLAFAGTVIAATLAASFLLPAHAQVAQTPQDAQDLKAAAQTPDAPPVPPELQALADTFVAAMKAMDEAALDACWHSPNTLAAAPQADARPGDPTLPRDRKGQLDRSVNDAANTRARASQMHTLITRHFGGPEQLKLLRVELSRGAAASSVNEATYDDVKLHFLAAGATHLMMSIDDVVKIDGVWKFRGRLKDQLTIVLPDAL